jgi:hypothetical protein
LDPDLKSLQPGSRLNFSLDNLTRADFMDYSPAVDPWLAFYPRGVITDWDTSYSFFLRNGYLQNKRDGKVVLFNINSGMHLIIKTPIENNDLSDLNDWGGSF